MTHRSAVVPSCAKIKLVTPCLTGGQAPSVVAPVVPRSVRRRRADLLAATVAARNAKASRKAATYEEIENMRKRTLDTPSYRDGFRDGFDAGRDDVEPDEDDIEDDDDLGYDKSDNEAARAYRDGFVDDEDEDDEGDR